MNDHLWPLSLACRADFGSTRRRAATTSARSGRLLTPARRPYQLDSLSLCGSGQSAGPMLCQHSKFKVGPATAPLASSSTLSGRNAGAQRRSRPASLFLPFIPATRSPAQRAAPRRLFFSPFSRPRALPAPRPSPVHASPANGLIACRAISRLEFGLGKAPPGRQQQLICCAKTFAIPHPKPLACQLCCVVLCPPKRQPNCQAPMHAA